MSTLITMDIGNSIIKTNKGITFNSQIMKTNVNNIEFSEAILYKDECFAIGQGEYENSMIKCDKNFLEHFVLYGIACSTKDDDVKLILSIPVNQLSTKENLINRLQGKSFSFIINSNEHNVKLIERSVKISKVAVVGESIASYYSLTDELSEFLTILDIGSKNINYATYTEIGKNDLLKSGTLDFGIHDFYNNIIEYYKNEKHITYSLSDIDKRVKSHRIFIPESMKKTFIEKIKNAITGNGFLDYNDYSLKCVGGGSLVLKDELEESFADAKVIDDPVLRNVRGLELIGNTLGF